MIGMALERSKGKNFEMTGVKRYRLPALLALGVLVVAIGFVGFIGNEAQPGGVANYMLSGPGVKGFAKGLAKVDEGKFIFVDFRDFYLLDLKANRYRRFEVDKSFYKGDFQPTSVAYRQKDDTLFAANYLRRNVLIVKVNRITWTGRIKSVITNGFVSPTTVALASSSDTLLVADHGGNAVIAYDVSGDLSARPPRELWRVRTNLASGLFSRNGKVYATDLRDRTLSELDLRTGKVVRTAGGPGIDRDALVFVWPSHIAPYDDDSIMIVDNGVGHIKIVNEKDFTVERTFGKHAPGIDGMVNPMYPIVFDGRILIPAPYQRRFVEFDHETLRQTASYWFTPAPLSETAAAATEINPWEWLRRLQASGGGATDDLSVPTNWTIRDGNIQRILEQPLMIARQPFHPGNMRWFSARNALQSRDHPRLPNLRMPIYSSIFNYSGNFDLLHFIGSAEDGYLLFSPRNGHVLAVFQFGGFVQFFPITLEEPWDKWPIGGEVVNRWGPVKTVQGVPVTEMFRKLRESALNMPAMSPLDRLSALCVQMVESRLLKECKNSVYVFTKALFTDEGKEFWKVLTTGATPEALMAEAKRYFAAANRRHTIEVQELFLISMVSGIAPFPTR